MPHISRRKIGNCSPTHQRAGCRERFFLSCFCSGLSVGMQSKGGGMSWTGCDILRGLIVELLCRSQAVVWKQEVFFSKSQRDGLSKLPHLTLVAAIAWFLLGLRSLY